MNLSSFQKKAALQKYANAARAVLVKRALYKEAKLAKEDYKWQTPDAYAGGKLGDLLKALWSDAKQGTSIGIDWANEKPYGYAAYGGLGALGGASIPLIAHLLKSKDKRDGNKLWKQMLLGGGIGGAAGAGLRGGIGLYLNSKKDDAGEAE